jgi:hypothetical protein
MKNAEQYALYDHHYKVTNIINYDDILSADNEEYIYILILLRQTGFTCKRNYYCC